MKTKQTCRGFTLVELLVVIGIIALLISILLPSLNKAQQQARSVQCASNLRQLVMGVLNYASDNGGSYPPDYGAGSSNGKSPATFDNVHWVGNAGSVWYDLESYSLKNDSMVRLCPEVFAWLGHNGTNNQPIPTSGGVTYPNAQFSYLYNKILGGMQAPGSNYNPYNPQGHWPLLNSSTNQVWAVPFKIGQFRNSSNVGVFMDGLQVCDYTEYDWPNNINNGFNLQYQPDRSPEGHQQFEGDGIGGSLTPIHFRILGQGIVSGVQRSEGFLNVAFADGSVRSERAHIAEPNQSGGAKLGTGWIDETACDPSYAP